MPNLRFAATLGDTGRTEDIRTGTVCDHQVFVGGKSATGTDHINGAGSQDLASHEAHVRT